MQKLHFSILISAPREKVWDTMLNDETYRQWTTAFSPGSCYVGGWEKGESIRFVSEEDKESGMFARIVENRRHDFISIEHLGEIKDGVEELFGEEVAAAGGFHENYTFNDKDGQTELLIDVDSDDKYVAMFKAMWPAALQQLKELCES